MSHRTISLALASCLAACGGGGLDPDETSPDAMPEVRTEIVVLPTEFHDERADQIDFSTGEPVHTHAGPTFVLGGPPDYCPGIYKYGYLLDREPRFGRQTTQNPIAWRVLAPTAAPLDDSASAYRILTEGGEILLEWTPMPAPDADGVYTVALYRDDVPALGQPLGKLHLDVRFRDVNGAEQVRRLCWFHNAMPAPLAFEPPVAADTPRSLFGITLANDEPLAPLLSTNPNTPPGPIDVVEQQFVQHTAEPVELRIQMSDLKGTFARTVVDDYVEIDTYGITACSVSPAKCNETPVPDPPNFAASGALTTGAWRLRVLGPNGNAVCTGAAPLSCAIPGRAEGEGPRPYRIVASAFAVTDLWSGGGAAMDVTMLGLWFVGHRTGATIVRCDLVADREVQGQLIPFCTGGKEYERVIALDRARLDLDPISMTFATAHPEGGSFEKVTYLPNGTLTTPPLAWDGGDDDLPGPN